MSAPKSPAAPKRRGRLKRVLLSLLVFLVLVLVAAWFAIPAVLSSDWGREKVRAALSDAMGQPVEVANLKFGWSSGLVVRGFSLGAGEDALRAKSLSADPDLLSFLGSEMKIRKIALDGLDLVIVRRADGTFYLPAMESMRKEPAPPAPEAGPATPAAPGGEEKGSPLARLSVALEATEVRILVRDEAKGELLRFGPVAASMTITAGQKLVPVRLFSKEEGFDLAADLELLDGDRMRKEPAASGTLTFTGMDLGRYAKIAAVVGQTEGLTGRIDGRIKWRAAGADRQSVEMDVGIRDAGVAAAGLAGEARLTGTIERTGDSISGPGFVLAVPGGRIRLEEVKKDGERASVRARVDVDVPLLRAALRGVEIPGPVGKAELVLTAELVGDAWSARLDGTAMAEPGRPLLDLLPEIGDRATVAGKLTGDRDLTVVRIAEPLTLSAGPESLSITGEIRDPKSDARAGRIDAVFSGPLLKPGLESLAQARMEGRAEGTFSVTLGGGLAELSGELALFDLVLSKPGVPEIREPRVSIRPAASFAFADGAISVAGAAIDAQGVSLSLTGPITGLPANPAGKGKLVITGDLSRIRPFLPAEGGLAPAGALRIDLDISGDGREIRTAGLANVTGLRLREDQGIGDVRTTLDLTWRGEDRVLGIGRLKIESPPATLDFSGTISLAADVPTATGAGNVSGDLSRLRPWLPADVDLVPSGTFRVDVDLSGDQRLVKAGLRATVNGLDLGRDRRVGDAQATLDATWRAEEKVLPISRLRVTSAPGTVDFSGTVSLAGEKPAVDGTATFSGDLGRIPAGFRPKDFVPKGTFEGSIRMRTVGGEPAAAGRITLARLDLGQGFVSSSAEVNFDVETGKEILVRAFTLVSDPARVEASGRLDMRGDVPRFVGTATASGRLENLPAALLPAGFAGKGTLSANIDFADPAKGRATVNGQGIVLTGVPGVAGTVREERLLADTALVWPEGAKLPRLGDGRLEIPAATLAWTGVLDPEGASRLTAQGAVNAAVLVQDHPGLFPDGLAATGTANLTLLLAGDLSKADPLGLLTAQAQIELPRAAWTGYEVTKGSFALTLKDRQLRIVKGEAILNGGPAKIGGGADLGAKPIRLDFSVDTQGVKLGHTMEPQAKYLAPIFGNATQLSGLITLKTDLKTSGAGGDALLKGLTGTMSFKVNDGAVTGSPILSAILGWLGEPADLKFTNIGGNLMFKDGRVGTDDLVLSAANVTIRFQGFTGMDGAIDYKLGVKLPENSSQAEKFKAVLGGDGFIPLGLGGSFSAPALKPPDLKDLAGNALDGILKKGIGDIFKKK